MSLTSTNFFGASNRDFFRWAISGFLISCLLTPFLGTGFLWVLGGYLVVVFLLQSIAFFRPFLVYSGVAFVMAVGGWGWTQIHLDAVIKTDHLTQEWLQKDKTNVTVMVESIVTASATGASFEGTLLSRENTPTPPYAIRIYLPGNIRPSPGSLLQGMALLGRPEGNTSTGAKRVFFARKIRLSAYFSSPRVIPGNPGIVGNFSRKILEIFDDTYPSPLRGVLAGILLGNGSQLEKTTVEDFRISGLAHMLVASGSNVAIVLLVLGIFFRRLPGSWGVGLAIAGGVLFASLAGGGAPVVRAAIMGLVVATTTSAGGRVRVGHLLLATLALFAIQNPLSLAWDPSLRLSFCATAGAIWLTKPLAQLTKFIPRFWGIREALVISTAATLSTLPISILDFEKVSLAAIPANLLAGWAVAPTMAFGALSAFFAWWTPLRDILGFGAWICGTWILHVAEWGAHVSWASIPLQGIWGWFWVILLGGFLTLLFIFTPKKDPSILDTK